jgi:hypothetical protein
VQVAGLTPGFIPRSSPRKGVVSGSRKKAKKESRKSAAHQLISRSDCFDFLNPFLSGAAEKASRRDDDRLAFLQPVLLQEHRPGNLPAAVRIFADMSPMPFYHLQISFPGRHYIIKRMKKTSEKIYKKRRI